MMTRRFLLAALAATAAAPALPAPIPAPLPLTPPAPSLPAWVIGHADEYDAIIVRAKTAEDAIKEWFASCGYPDRCACGLDTPPSSCRCDYCSVGGHGVEAWRAEIIDGIENPTPADWLRAGFGHTCSRCGYETHPYGNGAPIGDEAVCEECLTAEETAALRGEADA